jgi:O-antigen/teichoic acid export membrane protein
MSKLVNKAALALGIDRGLSYVSIGYFFYVTFGAVLWFILASEMSAYEYGLLNYDMSVTTIFAAVGMLGFETTTTTFLAKGVTRILSESVFLTWIAALFLSIILAILFRSLPIILVYLGTLFFILSLAEVLGRRLYKEYMLIYILQRILSLIFVPVLFVSHGIDGALYGYFVSYLPLCYRFFMSSRRITFSISTLIPIKNFFFHSWAFGISRALVLFSDKLIIGPLFGVALLGYYQLGVQMLSAVSVIPLILSHYLLPQEAASKNENVKKVEKLGLILSILICISLIYLTPTIISNFFPRFEIALHPIQIVLLAGIPLSVVATVNSFLLAREKSLEVLIASAIFLGTEFTLLTILGLWYGLMGLSLSPVLAATAQALFLLIVKRKVSKI